MSIDLGFPPALSFLTRRSGAAKSVVQIYRCPKGHLNEIAWTASEVELAMDGNDFKFYCPQCDDARVANPAEASSILAALGLRSR